MGKRGYKLVEALKIPTPTPTRLNPPQLPSPQDFADISYHLGNLEAIVHALHSEVDKSRQQHEHTQELLAALPTMIHTAVATRLDEVVTEQELLSGRIQRIELWQKFITGGGIAVSFAVGSGWLIKLYS